MNLLSNLFSWIVPVIIGGLVLSIVVLLAVSYKKCPPDQVYIISGYKKQRKLSGEAGFIIPFLERYDVLSLAPISIDVKTKDAVPNTEFIDVRVDAAVKVCIDVESEEGLSVAAKYFLNQDSESIMTQVVDTLEGNIREIIGQLTLEEMVKERKTFAEKVQENAAPDLAKLGIKILSFNVQGFEDQNGVINNLGVDNVERIRKNASIAKNEALRDVEISASQAKKVANDARVAAEREIFIKNNELELQKAALREKEGIAKAKADAAYNIEIEAQRKSVEQQTAEANIMKTQKSIEITKLEADIEEQKLSAEIKKKSDADLYRRTKEAEAKVVEAQKEAESIRLKALADAEAIEKRAAAEAAAKKQNLLAEAEGLKAKGLAEAEGIKAKGLAEAEAIDKKADAMKKYGEAAIAEMYFNAMPQVAKEVAAPLANVDKITMFGEGNSSKLTGDITKTIAQVEGALKESTGLDIKSLLGGFIGGSLAPNKSDKDKASNITE